MRQIYGKSSIQEQASDLLTDESRSSGGVPDALFFPENREDIITIIHAARNEHKTVSLIGGHTGVTGGAVPQDNSYAISFSSMNKIRKVTTDENKLLCLVCDPGISLAAIDAFLASPKDYLSIPGADTIDRERYFYPPDPTEMTAQLGGTVATNASGARSYYYGPTRKHVAEVEIVLASGEHATVPSGAIYRTGNSFPLHTSGGTIINIPGPTYSNASLKNAAGYKASPQSDLLDLLVGSEGTLAIFSEVTIRLQKMGEFLSGLSFFETPNAAFNFADFLRCEQQVAAIEYFDSSAINFLDSNRDRISVDLPVFPKGKNVGILWEFIENNPVAFSDRMDRWETALIASGSSFDDTWSGFDEQGQSKLKSFRHALPELVNSTVARNKTSCAEIRKISTDAAVPLASFQEVFEAQTERILRSKIPYVAFGHLGDAHLHFNLMPRSESKYHDALSVYRDIMAIAIEHKGTVSAEHGIGKLKKEYLRMMYGNAILSEMIAIKKAFDPEGILNPGNLFD